jgi:hypothetical protein
MGEVEVALGDIAQSSGSAEARLRALITANERMNRERYASDRKLHEMVEIALGENWPIILEHVKRVDALLERVLAEGMASGEFAPADPKLAARLLHAACTQYCHPRLMVECSGWDLPTSFEMLDFCLRALRGS